MKRRLAATLPLRLAIVFGSSFSASGVSPNPAPVVRIDRWQRGQIHCKVDAQPFKDLLMCFNVARERNPSNRPIVVLVDSKAPIYGLWDLQLIAAKAEVSELRFFALFRETAAMAEIKPMPRVRSGAP